MEFLDLRRYLGLPVLASEHGKDVDSFIVYVHWLMLLLFVGWLTYFLLTLFKFSRKRNPKADYVGVTSHTSSVVEVVVVLAEAFLLIGCAIPLWARVVEEFPNEKDATVVRVTAQQFAWNSRYPGKDGVFGRQDVKLRTAENQFGIAGRRVRHFLRAYPLYPRQLDCRFHHICRLVSPSPV